MGGKSSPPPPPDYRAAAEETAAGSQEAARQQMYYNRPEQVTPFGSQQWDYGTQADPTTGKPYTTATQTTTLEPRAQAALGGQLDVQAGRSGMAAGMLGNIGQSYQQPFSFGSYGGYQGLPGTTQSAGPAPTMGQAAPVTREDIAKEQGYGGGFDTGDWARWSRSTEELDPYLRAGDDPTKMKEGLSQANRRALARMRGFEGEFGVTEREIETEPEAAKGVAAGKFGGLLGMGREPEKTTRIERTDEFGDWLGQQEGGRQGFMDWRAQQAEEMGLYNPARLGGRAEIESQIAGGRQAGVESDYQQAQAAYEQRQQAAGTPAPVREPTYASQYAGQRAAYETPRQRYTPQAPEGTGGLRQQELGRMREYAAPNIEQQRARTETQLANQGITRGSEAWNNAMRSQEDMLARQDLGFQMAAGGEAQRAQAMGGEQQRQLGMEQQRDLTGQQFLSGEQQRGGYSQAQDIQFANYQNNLRQMQLAEAMQQRGMPLNELNALLTGQQVGMPQMPGFQGASMAQSPNYLGAAQAQGQYDMDLFNADQASRDALMGGLFSMGGMAMMCDIRVKRNLKHIGYYDDGIPQYAFQYLWSDEWFLGPVAQEVEAVRPDLVIEIDGIKHVKIQELRHGV